VLLVQPLNRPPRESDDSHTQPTSRSRAAQAGVFNILDGIRVPVQGVTRLQMWRPAVICNGGVRQPRGEVERRDLPGAAA